MDYGLGLLPQSSSGSWAICKCFRRQDNAAKLLGGDFLKGLYPKSGSQISGKLLILPGAIMLAKPNFSMPRFDGGVKPKPVIVADKHFFHVLALVHLSHDHKSAVCP